MPNFCNGHYFLTVLAPVKTGVNIDREDNFSDRQRLLETLARLPNSEVTVSSAGTGGAGHGSPFARNDIVHLARFVLIDAPAFNGRVSGDTLVARLTGVDPLAPQRADALATPYLLFAADLDAPDGSDAALERCVAILWQTMGPELREIFGFCIGFEGVASARDFFTYVKRCQVETTMPFNDYWPEDAALPADMPLPIDRIITGAKVVGGAVVLWLVCLLLAALLPASAFRDATAFVGRWGLLVVPLLLAAAAAYLYMLYSTIMRKGAQPLPAGATLPQVLKALYLQQGFTRFVIDNQGVADADLHRAFGAFAGRHKPSDLSQPTQPRGVIGVAKGASA